MSLHMSMTVHLAGCGASTSPAQPPWAALSYRSAHAMSKLLADHGSSAVLVEYMIHHSAAL